MDLICNLEAGRSEDVTGKEAQGKPARAQYGDVMVPSILEGGQEMQGEESGVGDRSISGELSAERSMEQDTEVVPRSQGSPRVAKLPQPEKYWNKPQPCGRTSTGGTHRRESHYQSRYNR